MSGIYIHIPFCKNKCTYCDFASFPKEIGKKEAYFACLYKEMKHRAKELETKTFSTVYFGGGTPSFIEEKYITGALKRIKEVFSLTENPEITIEMNPGTVNKDKINAYLKAGINRFSVGLQCANDKILASVNRIHNVDDFKKTMLLLKGQNVSVDVMIGLPEETWDDVKRTIDLAYLGGAKHISLYALKPEEGTIMYSKYLNGELPDGDEVRDLYDKSVDYLATFGYKRYEVSNFAMDGYYSKHNYNYWKRGEYIGFGVSASSFINERRFTNTESIDEYIHLLLNNRYAEIFSENIEGKERNFEYVMLGLRTNKGIIFKDYKNYFATNFLTDFAKPLKEMEKYLDIFDDRVKIKDEFLYVQNNIIIKFME